MFFQILTDCHEVSINRIELNSDCIQVLKTSEPSKESEGFNFNVKIERKSAMEESAKAGRCLGSHLTTR